MRILVTGAAGFVGGALVDRLVGDSGHGVRASYRTLPSDDLAKLEARLVGELGPETDWSSAVADVEVVVHCAALTSVKNECASDMLSSYRQVNVEGTLLLAKQSAAEGVKRFIFVSSIKVNGETTARGYSFSADDLPKPEDAYGRSKWEAEQGLRDIADQTGMEVVVIRPPLVYGSGVKGNFAALMRWLARGTPLPLGAVTHNRRSLVALDNLVGLIVTCLDHPAAANQTFLVSDGEDLSTADLLCRLGRAIGRPVRLLPVPVGLLELGARLAGKPEICQRLCGSLQVDISKTRQLLGWVPPVGVDEGLKKTLGGLGADTLI